MIKKIAWNIFKNTGDINTFLELKQIQDIEEKTGSGCGSSQKRTSFKTSSGNRLQPGRV